MTGGIAPLVSKVGGSKIVERLTLCMDSFRGELLVRGW